MIDEEMEDFPPYPSLPRQILKDLKWCLANSAEVELDIKFEFIEDGRRYCIHLVCLYYNFMRRI